MNEEKVSALARAEIRVAFEAASRRADWYTSGYSDTTTSAAYLVKNVADSVVQDLEPKTEPEPPADPFAPQRTAAEWAADVASLLEMAQSDGHIVWFSYRSGGTQLRVGSDDTAPVVWGSSD